MLRLGHFAVWLTTGAAALSCGSAPRTSGAHGAEVVVGSAGRIEQRSLSDRPPLAIIEREGDPEAAIGFASLAAESPELHAELGQVLSERLTRAGFASELTVHGLGFELTLLTGRADRVGAAMIALLQALQAPITSGELPRGAAPEQAKGSPTAVALCSAELGGRRRVHDAALLESERVATFAQDRSAFSVVGDGKVGSAVADVLAAGPDWPERGAVRSTLPERAVTQVVRGQQPSLSLALTIADPNRALGAAAVLGQPHAALGPRLAALGAGLRLRRVTATAHPSGACLRIDSDVDASPLPEPRRLGFALAAIEEEARLALAESADENRLEATALSATDPRQAARAAAYRALVAPATTLASQRLIALTAPDEGPLAPSVEQAIEQAYREPVPLDTQVRVETGQAGLWALVAMPCASASERAETAGHAALFVAAASAGATRGVRLEPWVGAGGVGLLGFVERARGESEAQAATRLGDALGQALVAAPTALEVAAARAELLRGAGDQAHPLLEGLLEALLPGHVGALVPRGSVSSLQGASREAILARQRELLRSPHRLALLSPSTAADAGPVGARLARWLRSPDAARPSPCGGELAPPARGELSLPADAAQPEGYLAFRIPAKAGSELNLLVELLNLPGGALERSLAEPELVGAARALPFGTQAARALVIQVSAFDGREAEALSRVQKLFERLSAGGVLTAAELEAAAARQVAQHRLAALDPRYRLVQLLEPQANAPADGAALRRLASSLRPEAAIVARRAATAAPAALPGSGKAAPGR